LGDYLFGIIYRIYVSQLVIDLAIGFFALDSNGILVIGGLCRVYLNDAHCEMDIHLLNDTKDQPPSQ
jgi:hypothetical protein